VQRLSGNWLDSRVESDDYVRCVLYLDCGRELDRLLPLVELWHDEAERLLGGAVRPVGHAGLVSTEKDAAGRYLEVRPRRWSDALHERLYLLTARFESASPEAAIAELGLDVHRFGEDRRHVALEAAVRTNLLDAVLPLVLALLARVAEDSDPAYGEVVVNAELRPPDSNLDIALRRKVKASADASRQWLRGYEWLTVCPAQLVQQLGGIEALRGSGAFAEITPLTHGGALLQATASPRDYGKHQARAVFDVLAPVLPPGVPRLLPGTDLGHLVLRDAHA
jgi:hypothetical protein